MELISFWYSWTRRIDRQRDRHAGFLSVAATLRNLAPLLLLTCSSAKKPQVIHVLSFFTTEATIGFLSHSAGQLA